MANNDLPDPVAPPISSDPQANGYHGSSANEPSESDPARERFRLRAQCAKLRHWCRDLLNAEGTDGVLVPDAERELRETPPAMAMDEVFAALRVISQGQPLPATARALTDDVTALAIERERLRKLFFTLHDAALPWDEIKEDYLLEQLAIGAGPSISEILNQLDGETGSKP